jgi:predicted DNA-binding protein (UPF0251 family)
MITDEQIDWTRDALAHLYSTAFLQRHARDSCLSGHFDCIDGAALQQVLFRTIQQLQPPPTTSSQSLAWRLFTILRLRYLEGLSQAEVADELYLSLRHLKREQQRAVEAVAALVFEHAPSGPLSALGNQNTSPEQPEHQSEGEWSQANTHPPRFDVSEAISKGYRLPDILHLEEMLRASLDVLDAALQEKNLLVNVTISGKLHNVRADAMIVRQLLIGELGWMIHGVTDRTLEVRIMNDGAKVVLRLQKPLIGETAETGLSTVRQLAEAASSRVSIFQMGPTGSDRILEIRLPA